MCIRDSLESMEERMSSFLQEAADSGMMAPMMGGDMTDGGDENAPQDDFVPGGSPVFPFGFGARQQKTDDAKGKNGKKDKAPRRKFLDTYCENLTQKAVSYTHLHRAGRRHHRRGDRHCRPQMDGH